MIQSNKFNVTTNTYPYLYNIFKKNYVFMNKFGIYVYIMQDYMNFAH